MREREKGREKEKVGEAERERVREKFVQTTTTTEVGRARTTQQHLEKRTRKILPSVKNEPTFGAAHLFGSDW